MNAYNREDRTSHQPILMRGEAHNGGQRTTMLGAQHAVAVKAAELHFDL
jgi:hypothetical protein